MRQQGRGAIEVFSVHTTHAVMIVEERIIVHGLCVSLSVRDVLIFKIDRVLIRDVPWTA